MHVREGNSAKEAHLEKGEPLNIGRHSRMIPPSIRRALKARDGGCRFPGCTNHKFVDGHHIKHWSDGGETSLDNLVLLCRHQRLNEFQQTARVSIEETLAWMYRKFAVTDVAVQWYAGEELDMEHAVWLMTNAKARGQRDSERPECAS